MLKEVVNNGNFGSLQIIDCNRIRAMAYRLSELVEWWLRLATQSSLVRLPVVSFSVDNLGQDVYTRIVL